MKGIATFLMFEKGAEEAVSYYLSLFPDTRVIFKQGEGTPQYMIEFELQGHRLMAYNGGSDDFKFALGTSLFINCDTQEEVDRLWEKLSDGGKELDCGWVQDRWGMYWQIIPTVMTKFLTSPDREKAERAVKAMLKMQKLDINELTRAYEGE